jgi:hypothetical protein
VKLTVIARKFPLRSHLLRLVCPLASAARPRLPDRTRSTSSTRSHHSLHLVSLGFVPHSASAPLDLVSRSISCLCIGTPKTLFSLVLGTGVARYGHRRQEICAPVVGDLRTGSTTPLCRFHVIAGRRSSLFVSRLLPRCHLRRRLMRSPSCRSLSSPSKGGSGSLNGTESGT